MSEKEAQMPFERLHAPTVESLNKLFDNYDFKSLIAVGGMGAVYLAIHESLGRKVAIKILPRRYSRDPLFWEAFTAEAKTIAKLNHHNLVSIYDFGSKEELPYLVMEYVEGEGLDVAIQRELIPLESAAKIIQELCNGLAHAHKRGVVHRDIKPSNLMFHDGEIKLVDFGIAKQCGYIPLKKGELVYGTIGFAAPEITAAPDQIDPRSDIYSIGATLCQLVTGYTPEDLTQKGREHRDLLGPLYPIVFKSIRTDMANRFQSVNELSNAISVALHPEEPTAIQHQQVAITLRRDGAEEPVFSEELQAARSTERQQVLHEGTQAGVDQDVMVGDRYQLGQCLSQGSRTMVYLAQDTLMKRVVKIRLFFKSDSSSWSSDFLEILTKLSTVEHPNIPKVLDAGLYRAGAFVVYGWGEGQDVSQFLELNLEYKDYYAVALQVLDALEVASHYGFHHHALNILSVIREPRTLGGGRYMLMDVGVSEILELIHVDDTHLPGVLPEWAAEEQFHTAPEGEQTTIYNFGQMMFSILIKGHPLAGMSHQEIQVALEQGFVADVMQYRNDLPVAFVDWFVKLTEPNIEKRFKTLREARKAMPKRPKGLIL